MQCINDATSNDYLWVMQNTFKRDEYKWAGIA